MTRTLIDTSLWVDFTRARSPASLKQFIAPYICDAQAHLAEPIAFEVLRHATPQEISQLHRHFQTFPLLPVPTNIWTAAATLGQNCRSQGFTAGSLDLVIAAIAIHHRALLVTFDEDFQKIGRAAPLHVKLLQR